MINRWHRYGHIHRSIMLGSVFSLTALGLLGLWSCQPTPPPEPELPEVTLKPIEAPPALTPIHCAIAADSPSLALMYVASDLGYFENEGLEIKVTKVPPSTAPKQLPLLNLLLQDDIDCVAQTLDGYLRTQDGQLFQTAVIASLYTSTGADGLVVTPPITSINDLLDQAIGGDRHHPAMLLTYQALRQLGYSVEDVVIKPIVAVEEAAEAAEAAEVTETEESAEAAEVTETEESAEAAEVTETEESTEAAEVTETEKAVEVAEAAEAAEAEKVTEAEAAETDEVAETGERSPQNHSTEPPIQNPKSKIQNPPTPSPSSQEGDRTVQNPKSKIQNPKSSGLVRPSYADIFRQEGVVAIAASKPMLDHIAEDTGGRVLLTSVEFEDLLMGTLIVAQSELEQDSDRYRRLLRGIYQAIALYNSDRSQFLQVAAASYEQPPQELEQALHGISYTSYPDLQRIIGAGSSTGTLFQTFTDLNVIHQDLGLQNGPLFYDDHIDNRLIPNLFDLDP